MMEAMMNTTLIAVLLAIGALLIAPRAEAIACNAVYSTGQTDTDCQPVGTLTTYVHPAVGSIPVPQRELSQNTVTPILSYELRTSITGIQYTMLLAEYPATYTTDDRILVLPKVCVNATACWENVRVKIVVEELQEVGKQVPMPVLR